MGTAQTNRRAKVVAVIRVASGNFLEMYDFMVFGYYAAAIGRAFFPKGSEFASLMLSLATFGVGFLMRPLGALVLGAYIDRQGRRAGLILTLALMSVGTISIACVPGYNVIGVLAPLLVVAGRLLQGFSAGVELGGVAVYLSEIATPGNKGFYVSWQSASQQCAVVFAACELAIRQPAMRRRLCGFARRHAEFESDARADGGLGMACAAAGGLPHHPFPVLDPQFTRRNRGVSGAQSAPFGC